MVNKLFRSRKGFLTKTNVLSVVILFYAVLFILIGYINSYFVTAVTTNTESLSYTGSVVTNSQCDCGVLTCSEYRLIHGDEAYNQLCGSQPTQSNTGFIGFLSNVIAGVSNIPWWMNTIIFGSLISIIGWILLSSLPTVNGGS